MTRQAENQQTANEPLRVGEIVFVAVGSRIGERGVVVRRDRKYVWLDPVGSEQPLGYYADWELSRDGMPLPEGSDG